MRSSRGKHEADVLAQGGDGSRSDAARRRRGRIALVLLLVVAAGTLYALSSWRDPRAQKGYCEGKSEDEIRDDLDTEVDWYSMEISLAGSMEVREGQRSVEARIENVQANHCDQKVRIYSEDNPDDLLFESGAIAPGEYLQTVELTHALPVGRHLLTVEFQGYEQSPSLISDEGQLLGHDRFGASAAAQVVLDVLPQDAD